MGQTWGPSGADRTQVRSMLAPWTLLVPICVSLWVSVSASLCLQKWPTIFYELGLYIKGNNLRLYSIIFVTCVGSFAVQLSCIHDDVIKWKHFPRYWPFVWCGEFTGQRKGQWRGASMFSLICVWINGWVSNREADDLWQYRVYCDVIIMYNWPKFNVRGNTILYV